MKNLVLVGDGHAHLAVLKNFGLSSPANVVLTLINRESFAAYSGMLPGLVAGHHSFDDSHIDLSVLARRAGAQFIEDDVTGIDPDTRLVHLGANPPIAFDLCSIDSGCKTPVHMIPGAEHSVRVLSPVSRFLSLYNQLVKSLTHTHEPVRIGFVGGGAGSLELMLAMCYAMGQVLETLHKPSDFVQFFLFQQDGEILPTHNKRVRRIFRRTLKRRNIQLFEDTPVVEAGFGCIETGCGQRLAVDHLFLVADAHPPDWLAESSLEKAADGFVAVLDTLQSTSHPHVFAAGDIAALIDSPLAKSGTAAARQGPVLARNLRRMLAGRELIAHAPRPARFSLISTGNKNAVLSWYGIGLKNPLVWAWKEHCDRRFIRAYRV